MAFIYRYELRDKELEGMPELAGYEEVIETMITEKFRNEENNYFKEVNVESDYFEFKSFKAIERKELRGMGHRLKSALEKAGLVGRVQAIPNAKYGFIRKPQDFYLIVYPAEATEMEGFNPGGKNRAIQHEGAEEDSPCWIEVELIDKAILKDESTLLEKAKEYKFLTNKNVGDSFKKGFYMDVLEAYVKMDCFSEVKLEKGEINIFSLEGYHRYADSKEEMENLINDDKNKWELGRCTDVEYVRNLKGKLSEVDKLFSFLSLKGKIVEASNEVKVAFKKSIEEFREEVVEADKDESIKDKLKDNLKAIFQSRLSESGGKRLITFCVHNVGQALATSFRHNDSDVPFLYFDFGIPNKFNSFTKPANINMPVKEGTIIIVSHIHEDHWTRIKDDPSAYDCDWYIPDQLIRKGFQKVLCGLNQGNSKGAINMITADLAFQKGRITANNISKINPTRIAKSHHETGLTFRLFVYDTIRQENISILIAGDQDYDYVIDKQLKNLDILVATHHGGEYSWTTRCILPKPRDSNVSVIIYSYGKQNKNNHPSKEIDYRNAGWRKANEHHTAKDNNFERQILLN